MIRKPTPKRQAEILVLELAKMGFTLGSNQALELVDPGEGFRGWNTELDILGIKMSKGQSLELVAKLEGYRGWNEYLAANPATPRKRIIIDKAIMQYLNKDLYSREDIPFASMAEKGRISDLLLAAYFQHSSEDSSTELHQWTSANGDVYVLQLSSSFKLLLTHTDGTQSYVSSEEGLTPEYIRAVTRYVEEPNSPHNECIKAPYFEWITDGGDPVGGVFDDIPLDASREMSRIRQIVEYHNL